VGGTPRFIVRGEGALVVDVDDNRYLDLVLSWGPLILGTRIRASWPRSQPQRRWARRWRAPTELELRLAERGDRDLSFDGDAPVRELGTEAVMSAVRLARAVTGRSAIVKFDGCYHGTPTRLARLGRVRRGYPRPSGFAGRASKVRSPTRWLPPTTTPMRWSGSSPPGATVLPPCWVEASRGNMGLVPPEPVFWQDSAR